MNKHLVEEFKKYAVDGVSHVVPQFLKFMELKRFEAFLGE